MNLNPVHLIVLAGLLQLVLVVAGCIVPFVFNWNRDLAKARTLTRQIFWTYAGYILAANVFFAVLCLGQPAALLDGSYLARCMTAYLCLYWLARIILQFTYFDRASAPQGPLINLAEIILVTTFVLLTTIYGWAAAINWGWIQ